MHALVTTLRQHPELGLFLTLALGFLIGRIRFGTYSLGNVVGTLLAGVLIGQLEIDIDPIVKTVFFALFLFATGYKVGPQFFRGLRRSALPQVWVTVVLCLTSLVTTIVVARVLNYDAGTAAGMMAGANTESTAIGTAGDMINSLDLPQEERDRLLDNVAVAYAVSYLVGTGFIVWFLSSLAPRLLRVDLKAESRKLEAQLAMGGKQEAGVQSAYREWDLRAYRLGVGLFANTTVNDLEQSLAPARVFVERIRHDGKVSDTSPETVLHAGDVIAVVARRNVILGLGTSLGTEVEDRWLLEFPTVTADIVLTNRQVAERTLAELAAEHGRGVVLQKLIRGGEEIPFNVDTMLNRGDLLRVVGRERDVARAGKILGYIERPSSETDIIFVGLGVVLGGLVGALTVTVAGVPLTLTASGGALIMGLVFGWLRSVRPTFGRIPEPALWVFDTLGLAVFIGIVGLNAGPRFVAGLQETGPSLLLVAFIVAVLPHVAALLFGHHILKMNPIILLGACAGAGTITAALRSIQDEAQSKLPVLGYTVPYAIGNILKTAWGPVIVILMQ